MSFDDWWVKVGASLYEKAERGNITWEDLIEIAYQAGSENEQIDLADKICPNCGGEIGDSYTWCPIKANH